MRHVGHDLPHLLAQAAEEVGEARGFLLKVVEFVVDVALRPAVGESTELLVRHGGETAGLRHVLRRVLQDIVEERADLRRIERRRAAGLGLEPVLQKVRVPAGGEALGLRRREVQPLAVERTHALGRELAAGGVRRARERGERGGVVLIEPCARRDGGGVGRPAQCAPGQLQRRGRGQKTLRVRVRGAGQRAEELSDARDEKRRARGRAIAVKERVGYSECLRRERHALVDEVVFAPERVVRAAADVELQLQQLAPLLGRKHAVRLAGARQPVVRRAEHDQVPDAAAAHAVEVAGRHAVECDGDRADVVTGEHAQKERCERVGVHLRAAEDGGKLFERADRQLPELGILGRERGAPLGAQAFGQRIEPLREVQPLEKIRQRHGLRLRRGGGAALRAKLAQGPCRALPQVVDLLQAGGGFVRVRRAVAVRVLLPRRWARPRAAADGPEQDVVFERVRLLRREPGEARAQVGRDVLGVPPAGHDVVGRADERHERLLQQVGAAGEIERHAVVGAHALERGRIVGKAAHGDGDVAPAAAGLHELQRAGGRPCALGRKIVRRAHADRVRRVVKVRGGVGKQLLLEYAQRRVGRAGGAGLGRGLHAAVVRHVEQDARRAPGGAEDLAAAGELIERETDRHVRAGFQQRAHDGQLLPRVVGEAVEVEVPRAPERARGDALGQAGQPVGGVGVPLRGHGVIRREHEREVAQLVAQIAGAARGRGFERVGRDARGLELVDRAEERLLHLRPAGGRAEQPQPRRHLAQRQRHAQQPPALIEQRSLARAGLRRDAARQPREAQHLGVQTQTVAAGGAQCALGLVAVLLRHEQHLPRRARRDGRADAPHEQVGLAAGGRAIEQMQHNIASLCVF